MNKITILKSHIPSKEFWELFDYASKKEVTHSRTTEYAINQCVVNHSVEITDEEINKYIMHNMHTPDEVDSAISLWNYIKSRINPQK